MNKLFKKSLIFLYIPIIFYSCGGNKSKDTEDIEFTNSKSTSVEKCYSEKINNDINELAQKQNIWLISLTDSPKDIEDILIKNHYLPIYDDKENSLFINNLTINYLSIDWDVCEVKFANNKSVSISFSRISPVAKKSEKISYEKISELKNILSIKYGEMREVRMDEDKDTKIYRWYGDDYIIELVDMFNGEMVVLSFFEDGCNPRISDESVK